MPPNSPLPRLVLKFKDTVQLPYLDDIGDLIEQNGIGPWNALKTQFPGIRIRRLYQQLDPNKVSQLVSRGIANDPTYTPKNLLTYFLVDCPPPNIPTEVAQELRPWPSVETVFVDRVPSLAQCSRGYETAATVGIDAVHARNVPGGDGFNQNLIDIETGWTLNHDALVKHAIPAPVFGVAEPLDCMHGTQVLGIVCGDDPVTGFTGIVPNLLTVRVASGKRYEAEEAAISTIGEAIADAASRLSFGDVILIEMSDAFLPCEVNRVCYDNIRAATAAGIVVVEAAGNGNFDLDAVTDDMGVFIFDRTVRDSLAVLVASSTSAPPYARRANSNYGTRIDCFAWGNNIFTATSAHDKDLSSFSPPCFVDTSGAAAIIAGAALSVQGMSEALLHKRLAPVDLRGILSDPNNGTSAAGADAAILGVMPDLYGIARMVFGFAPTQEEAPAPPTNIHIVS